MESEQLQKLRFPSAFGYGVFGFILLLAAAILSLMYAMGQPETSVWSMGSVLSAVLLFFLYIQ